MGAATTNTAPTADDNTVTTGEDRAYAFTADDFGFDDADAGATLASVTIVTPPMAGHPGARRHGGPGGRRRHHGPDRRRHAHLQARAQDAHGDPYTTFTFKVNDGTVDSAERLHDDHRRDGRPRSPSARCPDIAGDGRRQIWTGTVMVERVLSLMGLCYWLRISME